MIYKKGTAISSRFHLYTIKLWYNWKVWKTLKKVDVLLAISLCNRPFPSCFLLQFQNESSCKTIQMKITLFGMKMDVQGKHICYINGFARRLVLTQRQKVTRKWPILTLILCPPNFPCAPYLDSAHYITNC